MDDAKIDQIAREVMVTLRKSRADAAAHAPVPSTAGGDEPHLRLLHVAGGVEGLPCVIEPDKVCVGSLRCRSFGH